MFVYNDYSDRLGHVIGDNTSEQSPLLLLFLDCVWQLLQQFPEEFEFSETFLTTLWDSAFLPIFDTFLFNSEHDRQIALRKVSFNLDNILYEPNWIVCIYSVAWFCVQFGIGVNNFPTKIWHCSQIHCTKSRLNNKLMLERRWLWYYHPQLFHCPASIIEATLDFLLI